MESSDLKKFILEVAPDVSKLPEAIQLRAFELLLEERFGVGRASNKRRPAKSSKIVGGSKPQKVDTGHQRAVELALVRSLDLRGDAKDKPSLKDFVNAKAPATNIEFNAVAVYYLKEILGEPKIRPSHIFTCYKFCNRRSPKTNRGFIQSLYDTSSRRYGYIDATDLADIKSSMLGGNLVEHDLPKKVSN